MNHSTVCENCGEEFSEKRAALGYTICLTCGATEARKQAHLKAERTAPLFNKGGYQYITDGEVLEGMGKK